MTPQQLIQYAVAPQVGDKPLALQHLNWYLTYGGGRNFVEDSNISDMLQRDAHVQQAIAAQIPAGRTTGRFSGEFELNSTVYAVEDFQYSFGSIDYLDFQADFDAGLIHVWFQDCYEWHPYYPGIYDVQDGDFALHELHSRLPG